MKSKRVKPKDRLSFKLILFILTVLLLVIAGGMTTYALLQKSEEKTNDFNIGNLQTELVEVFVKPSSVKAGSHYDKKVTVKNTGDVSAFVRVLVFPEILSKADANGVESALLARIDYEVGLVRVEGQTPTDTYSINNETSGWVNGNDGYYYFTKAVKSGESTPVLFNEAYLFAGLDERYLGATLKVELRNESIHTTQWAYRDAWWNGEIPTHPQLLKVDNALKTKAHSEET